MSSRLVDRSPDLQRLRDEGYELEISGQYLLIHAVPYITNECALARGILVSDLTLSGDATARPADHVAKFVGTHPCNKDGSEIAQIKHSLANEQIREGLVTSHAFSNKPEAGYADYYEKMTTYIRIISAPAKAVDPSVTACTFKPIAQTDEDSVFAYMDTASSRAGLNHLTSKFAQQRIAIIGLGGTGSYVLDHVAKTPVAEIRLIDGDTFFQHNAFRSPGAASIKELELRRAKACHHQAVYGHMHRNIRAYAEHLHSSNAHILDGVDFAFVCVDSGTARREIVDVLRTAAIDFVDVGMGVDRVDDELIGMVRVTADTASSRQLVRERQLLPLTDGPEDEYARNIQISELNALNAAMAVIRWKKLLGIYQDLARECHSIYSLNVNTLVSSGA